MTKSNYHTSVLLRESVDALITNPDGVYVDVTFGGGGHSKEILKRLSEKGRLFAFDQDEDAVGNKLEDERFVLVHQNFRFLKKGLRFFGVKKVDGVLADLGVSSHQFDEFSRGFSFREDAVLDMRMGKGIEKTALDVLNNYSEEDLAMVFRMYGEVKNPKKLAWKIGRAREEKALETVFELKNILSKMAQKGKESKFYAQVFQALRIEVNDELTVLKEMLEQTKDVLLENGRLVVISYHSLEDRLVKNFLKTGNFEGKLEKDFYGNITRSFTPLNNKVIVPSDSEVDANPRARSAKMRIGVRNK